MAIMVYHELCCKGLKQKLAAAGAICGKTLKSKSAPEGRFYPHVLCYDNCNSDEWLLQKDRILKSGVVDYAKKRPDGAFGVRRDYTPEEQAELGFYPVEFSKGGNKMSWKCKWIANEDPAFYASQASPDDVVVYTVIYEDGGGGGCYIKNGRKITDKPLVLLDDANQNPQKLLDLTVGALKAAKLEDFAAEVKARASRCKTYSEMCSLVVEYVDFDKLECKEDSDEEYISL